jgi:uncharacterized protein (DUF302 family)
MPEFDYTVETSKSVEEATAAVETRAKEHGFSVLHTHDVQATLTGKGFPCEPLRIVEVCNAKYASQVLAADVKIALMLPCPISVYRQGGKTYISALRPSVMVDFYPEADIRDIAAEVERAIVGIVEAAR